MEGEKQNEIGRKNESSSYCTKETLGKEKIVNKILSTSSFLRY